MRAIPERFCSEVFLRRGAISSMIFTFVFTFYNIAYSHSSLYDFVILAQLLVLKVVV